jgi:hypothetical protein
VLGDEANADRVALLSAWMAAFRPPEPDAVRAPGDTGQDELPAPEQLAGQSS